MSLGLRPRWIMLKIVLPQALIIGLRPLGNEVILMIKGSAVAAIVTVFDLMGATRLAFARSFDITVYFYAAVLYLDPGRDAAPPLGPDRAPPDPASGPRPPADFGRHGRLEQPADRPLAAAFSMQFNRSLRTWRMLPSSVLA